MSKSHLTYGSFRLSDQKVFLENYHTLLGDVEIFVNLALEKQANEAESREIAENIFRITQEYLTIEPEKPVYERFEECLKQVNIFLDDTQARKEESIGDLHAIIAVLEGRTLHVTKTGLAESYLLRKGKLIDISEGLYEDNTESYFMNIATGELEHRDKVVFTSKRILKFVSKNELITIFTTSELDGALEELKEVISLDEVENVMVSAFELTMENEDQKKETKVVPPSERTEAEPRKRINMEHLKRGISKYSEKWKKVARGEDRNKYLTLGILVLVVLLLISLNFTSTQNGKNNLVQENKILLEDARSLLNKAKTAGIADKALAKELLNQSKKKAFEVRESKMMYADVMSLIQEIESEEEKLDNIVREKEPKVFVDLAKKDDKIDARGLIYFSPNRSFYVYTKDGLYGPIVDDNPDSYQATKVPEDELKTGSDFLDSNSLVFLTEGSKVMEFAKGKFEIKDTTDEVWKAGVAIRTFGNRKYIYILDPQNNNIWKYERGKVGYRGAVSYNTTNVDISDGLSFALDGSVYVLHKSGSITKLYDKQKVNLDIIGAPSQPLTDLRADSSIYTNEDTKYLYVLDTQNRRVLIYNKTDDKKLTYVKQYIFEKENLDVRGFYINQEQTKLYILSPQQIFVTDLTLD